MTDEQLLELINTCANPLFIIQTEEQKLALVREKLNVERTEQFTIPIRDTVMVMDPNSKKTIDNYKTIIDNLAILAIKESSAPETVKRFEINRIHHNHDRAIEIVKELLL